VAPFPDFRDEDFVPFDSVHGVEFAHSKAVQVLTASHTVQPLDVGAGTRRERVVLESAQGSYDPLALRPLNALEELSGIPMEGNSERHAISSKGVKSLRLARRRYWASMNSS